MSVAYPRHGRVCPKCGREFRSSRSDSVYCSGKCRMRVLREAAAIERAGKRDEAEARARAFAAKVDADRAAAEAAAKAAAKSKAAAGKKSKKSAAKKVTARGSSVTSRPAKGRAR